MNIWTIKLTTRHQGNTHCVDEKAKIKPYIHKCMWKMRKRLDVHYEIIWLATDFAVIYEKDYRGHVSNRIKYGEIHMYFVH
jgi:hypothetical protein